MKFFDINGTEITTDQLPRLVVLTGLNGSGKTRGLKHLCGTDSAGARYIDYRNFLARWDLPTFKDKNYRDEIILRQTIKDWGFHVKAGPLGPIDSHDTYIRLDEPQKLEWIKQNRKVSNSNFAKLAWSFFEIFPEAIERPFNTHKDLLIKHPDKAKTYWQNFGNETVPWLMKGESQESWQPAHCLKEDQLIESLDKIQRLESPLSLDLSKAISDYANKRNEFLYQECVLNGTARGIALETFLQNNPDPINYINGILESLKYKDNETEVFQFSVQSTIPEIPLTLEQLKNPLVNNVINLKDAKGELRNLNELSSGEQTMLALATLIYTFTYIQSLPALYLDEIDASLHPSMIQSMLDVLQSKSNKTRIFLATHSPSTVALADEASLFFMNDGHAKKIDRTSAIEDLSQGYFTTEGITSIFRQLNGVDKDVIVISEGKNYEYLIPILEKLGYKDRVHVHQWKDDGGKGAKNLGPLMALFAEMITSSRQKIVFLFDCDVKPSDYIRDTNCVKGVFLSNTKFELHYVQRGIENIIPCSMFIPLGESIYKKKNGEIAIEKSYKDKVKEHFISKLNADYVELSLIRKALKDLLVLCDNQQRETR